MNSSTDKPLVIPSKPEITQGAIAVLDILGVKGWWAREEMKTMIDEWKNIMDDFSDFVNIAENSDEEVKVSLQVFSDTIILIYESKNLVKALQYVSLHLTYPFCHSLLKKIFLRGTISVGKFIKSESLVVGPTIDEAAEWYELTDWMGISLSPSAEFLLNEHLYKSPYRGLFVRYDVPQKNGVIRNSWVIDWANLMSGVMESMGDKRDPKEALLNAFSGLPVSPSSFSKYTNTLKFYDEMLKTPNPNKTAGLIEKK